MIALFIFIQFFRRKKGGGRDLKLFELIVNEGYSFLGVALGDNGLNDKDDGKGNVRNELEAEYEEDEEEERTGDRRVDGDNPSRLPSSSGQEEEAALEDVLIITADKSLESLVDDMAPSEADSDRHRNRELKKDKSRDKEEKVGNRVPFFFSRPFSLLS